MKPESSLLLKGYSRVFHPEIAIAVGLHGAIFLQQLHFWLQRTNNTVDGNKWVYHSYTSWQSEGGLEFWSPKVIRTTIEKLEKEDLVISDCFNKRRYDKTKWYRINYDKLYSLCPGGQTLSLNGQIEYPELAYSSDLMGKPIPKTTAKITAKTIDNPDLTAPKGDGSPEDREILTSFTNPVYEHRLQPNDLPYIREVLFGALRYHLKSSDTKPLKELVAQHGKKDVIEYFRYLAKPECREHEIDKEFLKTGIEGLAEKCSNDTHDDLTSNQCPIEF